LDSRGPQGSPLPHILDWISSDCGIYFHFSIVIRVNRWSVRMQIYENMQLYLTGDVKQSKIEINRQKIDDIYNQHQVNGIYCLIT
jgi:hypothetical protein